MRHRRRRQLWRRITRHRSVGAVANLESGNNDVVLAQDCCQGHDEVRRRQCQHVRVLQLVILTDRVRNGGSGGACRLDSPLLLVPCDAGGSDARSGFCKKIAFFWGGSRESRQNFFASFLKFRKKFCTIFWNLANKTYCFSENAEIKQREIEKKIKLS